MQDLFWKHKRRTIATSYCLMMMMMTSTITVQTETNFQSQKTLRWKRNLDSSEKDRKTTTLKVKKRRSSNPGKEGSKITMTAMMMMTMMMTLKMSLKRMIVRDRRIWRREMLSLID
ncbi:hypothetical protein DPMN_104016 [Dreissena polymorpha]|uniref:Uncharacterized protein n=1 Tax=Dreissena polymorpha TaxID=45954 RepID=A0A9D4K1A1_DREPO|nr:hypothetical protein DPMN_104016 [Dreissena polymorpha]